MTPACPVARQCGGCQIQQMSYEAQLRFKEKLVDDNLKRIGKIEGYEFSRLSEWKSLSDTEIKRSIRLELPKMEAL